MTSLDDYQRPPDPVEVLIEDVRRVRWLVTEYFHRPGKMIRARDEHFDDLLCDPHGYVWGLITPATESGRFKPPYLKRCNSYLIGEDNLEVKQPII
jgi:hypothetical protein